MPPRTKRGVFTGPKTSQSKCVAYDGVRTWAKATLTFTSTNGTFTWQIGTDDNLAGSSISWEEITDGVELTLASPGLALFYRVVGSVGAVLDSVRIKYKV